MTVNLFVFANVKQLRTGGNFRILLPFFRTSWGVGVLNSAIFNNFHNRIEFGTILEGLRNFVGVLNPPPPPNVPTHTSVRHCPGTTSTLRSPPGPRMIQHLDPTMEKAVASDIYCK